MDAFIGLDLGTTSIKAVAFDETNAELAAAAMPTPTHRLADGGAEYDAQQLWLTAADVLRQVASSLTDVGHHARGIAVASVAESGVLLDAESQPLAPVIAWFDQRTEPQATQWSRTIGVELTQRITSLTPRPVFGAAKMLWTQRHLPDAWSRGSRWLNMADWAAYKLSGEMATDYSLASRTMLFDLKRRVWSPDLCSLAGIDQAMLAPLVGSGEAIGSLTAAASVATGLPEGTVVAAGGHDHVCAALALGVTEPGMLLDSIGTAEAFFLVTDEVDTSGRVASAMIGQGAHVEPGRTYAMTGLQQGGGRIDARRIELGLEWEEFLGTAAAADVIDELASDGQERIAVMLKAVGVSDVRHIVTGGGSENTALIARKREIGGRPIEVAAQTQATALGAAILARRAVE